MDYSKYKGILFKKENGIATITFNNPDYNPFTPDLHWTMEHIWLDLAEDEDLRAIILTGSGKAFSAGGNIKDMVARWRAEDSFKNNYATPGKANRIVRNMLDCPVPMISAINGDAMGLGATVALACDIPVMSEEARIGDTHVKVGLVAGDGGSTLWPMLIGLNRAKEFLMRGRVVKGKEAFDLGIVNHVVPKDQVMAKAMEIAEDLASLPPLAVRWTKISANKMMKLSYELSQDTSIAYETLCFSSEDHLEAGRAFIEKRKPKFRGL